MSIDFLFRLDANEAVGAGHLMRALALIERLVERRQQVAIWGRLSLSYQERLRKQGLPIVSQMVAARCLVVDCYDPLELVLKTWPPHLPVVLFEDLPERHSPRVDAVVDAMGEPAILAKHFPKARLYCGLQYLLFREEVRQIKRERESLEAHDSLVLSLGGSPQAEALARVCALLQTQFPRRRIEVFGNTQGLATTEFVLARGFSPDFLRRAAGAYQVVSAAGQSLLELAYIGVPAVGIVLAENQRCCGETLSEQGLSVFPSLDAFESGFRLASSKAGIGESAPVGQTVTLSAGADDLVEQLIGMAA